MSNSENFLIGIFDDEDVLVRGVNEIRHKGVRIKEVYSPFPVHGLDVALGYKRTRLPIAAFLFGLTGTSLGLFTQIWMLGFDWPMIIGGKNFFSIPPFIPVTFEFTVLLSAFGMVGTFFVVCNLKPYRRPREYDLRSTDDKHVMVIELQDNKIDKSKIATILKENGATEINEKSF